MKKLIEENNAEEIATATLQNEIANLQVNFNCLVIFSILCLVKMSILNTQRHNLQLKDTLETVEEELNNKAEMLQHLETDSRQKEGEIDKRTRELDALNRKYQHLTSNMEVSTQNTNLLKIEL